MADFVKNLNPKQQEAVLATGGPVLILAGPGSGKTRVLAHRVAHLLNNGVRPEAILAVTFTNKAAGEMAARIKSLLAENLELRTKNLELETKIPGRELSSNMLSSGFLSGISIPLIGTFHALAVRILRSHASKLGYLRNFTIMDADDSLSLIKEVMKEQEINPKQFSAGAISATISRLKGELLTPERYRESAGLEDLFPKTIHKAYAAYQKRLCESNAMDFDDLIGNVCLLFELHPDVLEQYQDRFRYINVDEWQDTNHAQYIFISELAKKYRNIAVVGDDAQAIYAWRGADFRNILAFEKDWPEAKVVILDQNYRSSQIILDAARGLISKNTLKRDKALWTENEPGEKLELCVAEDEKAEAGLVVNKIKDLSERGYELTDMVVLYRTNAQSRALEEALLDENIPYKIIGGVRFYQRKEIKDILAYLRYLLNPADLESLKRVLSVPPRGIGARALLARATGELGSLREREREKIKEFDGLVEKLKEGLSKKHAVDFLRGLIKIIRYQDYLEDSSPNAEERWDNVKELVTLAKKYDAAEPPGGVESMLEDVSLMTEADQIETGKPVINLMTLHAAKGLEFPIVFMVGMEEGVFPHSRSLFNPAELEEERRLCYVGLTRARAKVFLTFALRRTHFGSIQVNPPSRFISEIPEHLIEINEEMEDVEL